MQIGKYVKVLYEKRQEIAAARGGACHEHGTEGEISRGKGPKGDFVLGEKEV